MRRLSFLAALAAAPPSSPLRRRRQRLAVAGTPAQRFRQPTEQLFAGSATANIKRPAEGKRGGTLTVLSAGDVDFLDPGKTYYVYSIGIVNALHRGLYAYPPPRRAQAGARPRGRLTRRSPRTAVP